MTCSPLLFVVYLDHLLRKAGLLKHRLFAYADDLAFVVNDTQELATVILKL